MHFESKKDFREQAEYKKLERIFYLFNKADVSYCAMQKVNLEGQEIYLDLVSKRKTITSEEIKNIYKLFSENGEN